MRVKPLVEVYGTAAWIPVLHIYLTQYAITLPGVEVTKPISYVPLFFLIFSIVKTHVS